MVWTACSFFSVIVLADSGYEKSFSFFNPLNSEAQRPNPLMAFAVRFSAPFGPKMISVLPYLTFNANFFCRGESTERKAKFFVSDKNIER
jgi:hypothetical protein